GLVPPRRKARLFQGADCSGSLKLTEFIIENFVFSFAENFDLEHFTFFFGIKCTFELVDAFHRLIVELKQNVAVLQSEFVVETALFDLAEFKSLGILGQYRNGKR